MERMERMAGLRAGGKGKVVTAAEALALVQDTRALPAGKSGGGVLTPASGLGAVLADRLRQAGMTLTLVA